MNLLQEIQQVENTTKAMIDMVNRFLKQKNSLVQRCSTHR